jgi:hypothetical protein
VPPPPVAGATVSTGVGVGEAGGVVGERCVADGVGEAGGEAVRVAEGLTLACAVRVAELEAVGERVPPGENEDGTAEGGDDPEQPATAAEVSSVMVVHPTAASLARSRLSVLAAVGRVMASPCVSGQVAVHFRAAAWEAAQLRGSAWGPGCGRRP